jgi:hypothetical protein
MNSREQTLAIILIGAIGVSVAGASGYFLVYQPLTKAREQEATLTTETQDLEKQLREQQSALVRLRTARARSLPADGELAKREYVVALERMMESAGVPKGFTVTPKNVDQSARAVPEIAKGKPVYSRVAFEVVFKKVDMAALKEFLLRYYQFGVLHQITSFAIKKDDDAGARNAGKRNDLTVTFTTEAIIVEGVENRKTLLPVPTAFGAIGGGPLFLAMATNPEAARGVVLPPMAPALSPLRRDYDWLVRKDPFNGPIKEKALEAFKLDKISDVEVRTDEKHDPVKVKVSGDGSDGSTVTAQVMDGTLYAEGALKVDEKKHTIELPKTSATAGSTTISVIAISADRSETVKTSFKVSVKEKPDIRDDVSGAIILTGTTPRSDGTAWARIFDNANRLRYTVEATPRGVSVLKEFKNAASLPWKKDPDYDHPAGVLAISDEETKTRRTFRVLAVDIDGLIVVDLKPGETPPEKGKDRDRGKGGWPPPGGKGWPPKGPPKQGHANPLAVLGGNMATAIAIPKYYRWPVGQSLLTLKPLSDDEAKKVQAAVDASGPVFGVAIAP